MIILWSRDKKMFKCQFPSWSSSLCNNDQMMQIVCSFSSLLKSYFKLNVCVEQRKHLLILILSIMGLDNIHGWIIYTQVTSKFFCVCVCVCVCVCLQYDLYSQSSGIFIRWRSRSEKRKQSLPGTNEILILMSLTLLSCTNQPFSHLLYSIAFLNIYPSCML